MLELPRHPFWHYRHYGVRALLAMGRKAEAIQYAEASRGLNQPDTAIDQLCEEILISSGLHDEAYRHYGLSAATGTSYLARFRAVREGVIDCSARAGAVIGVSLKGKKCWPNHAQSSPNHVHFWTTQIFKLLFY